MQPTLVAERLGTWAIRGNIEMRRRAFEPSLPVIDLRQQDPGRMAITFPNSVIAILNRKRPDHTAGRGCCIERVQFGKENPNRPRIADDVMHCQNNAKVLFGDSNESDT